MNFDRFFILTQIPTDKVRVAAMENANYQLYGMTNGIYWFDVKNLFVASSSPALLTLLKMHAIKFGVYLDPFMKIAEYVIGDGATADDELIKTSTIGKAAEEGDHAKLGWPLKMKWRHDQGRPESQLNNGVGLLPECSNYIIVDRKCTAKLKMMLRPFNPVFKKIEGIWQLDALQKMVNDRFQIGHSVPERFFGQLVNMFPFLKLTKVETDLDFVKNSLEIFLHIWNLIKMVEDDLFWDFTARQRERHGSSYLAHYMVNPDDRFSTDSMAQPLETPEILTHLWTFYEPRRQPLQTTRLRFVAPHTIEHIVTSTKEYPEFLCDIINNVDAELEAVAEQEDDEEVDVVA